MSAAELLKQCEALSTKLQAMGLPHPEPNDDWTESISRINAAVSQLANLVGNVTALTDLVASCDAAVAAFQNAEWPDPESGMEGPAFDDEIIDIREKLEIYRAELAKLKRIGGLT